jgi:hypothetical protein
MARYRLGILCGIIFANLTLVSCAEPPPPPRQDFLSSPQLPVMRECIRRNAVALDDGRSSPTIIGRAAAIRCNSEIEAVKALVDNAGTIMRRTFREELDRSVVELGALAVLENRRGTSARRNR